MTNTSVPTPAVTGGDPVAALPGAQIQQAGGLDMSMLHMFMSADLVVKLVMLLLLAASFWSWTIIIDKWLKFRDLRRKMERFEQNIREVESLEGYYDRVKHQVDNPLAKVFVAGMFEWMQGATRKRNGGAAAGGTEAISLKMGIRERVFQAMSTARNLEISALEKNLGFLATTGSTAPFIGLFGTVWGIMSSFQAIALAKNTTLAVVAPGIAEALFATAIGLFAAIPAVIFYNKFANDVAAVSHRIDTFSDELGTIVSRQLDE